MPQMASPTPHPGPRSRPQAQCIYGRLFVGAGGVPIGQSELLPERNRSRNSRLARGRQRRPQATTTEGWYVRLCSGGSTSDGVWSGFELIYDLQDAQISAAFPSPVAIRGTPVRHGIHASCSAPPPPRVHARAQRPRYNRMGTWYGDTTSWS